MKFVVQQYNYYTNSIDFCLINYRLHWGPTVDLLVTEAVGVLPADTALDQAVVATVVLQSRERWAHTGGI